MRIRTILLAASAAVALSACGSKGNIDTTNQRAPSEKAAKPAAPPKPAPDPALLAPPAPDLPDAPVPPAMSDNMTKLVDAAKAANQAGGHGNSSVILVGKSGMKYEFFFNGSKKHPWCMIWTQPDDPEVTEPKSDVNQQASRIWDGNCDGTIDLGETGSFYAPVPVELRHAYESRMLAENELGGQNKNPWQKRLDAIVKDLVDGLPSSAPAPAAATPAKAGADASKSGNTPGI